jgi:hypothetical protein
MEKREKRTEKGGFVRQQARFLWLKAKENGAPHRDSDCSALRQGLT